ncbi:hypothetical protein CONCODRAFT_13418 [Conidiobolus coronatus NRRL 28638]|uniref:G-protein coupled receptors family 1 profile domain-containing protein n=1 Tax=Conidiobolus coronatus (strain ATCC 28846 / CBS 209.66 / NRRL 28638) TaxID=796925 RepID=A0A137NQR9_CONC2|nr:hypothetical protein CONCODRAFT_13418 [Conidiobolus coronatus NRRL 28638]|eukprot:KXN65107.1 hypothetical protein CONCODRAFT_13418 [Conidiobolus coronatus NRRL 28638]
MSSPPSPPTPISKELRDGILINIGLSGGLGLIFNLLLSWVLIKKVAKKGAHGDIILCTFVAITDVFIRIGANLILGLLLSLLIFSGYSLGVLSIERFLLICFNITFPVYTWFILIFIAWGSQFTLAIMSLTQGLQILSKTETQCSALPQGIGYIFVSVAVIFSFISFFIVITSYCSIMITKFRQCLNQINLNVPKDQVYIELRSTATKSIINIVFFLIVYMPKYYVAVFEVTTGKKEQW